MNKGIFLISILLFSTSSHAALEYTGKIKTLFMGPVYGDKVFIEVEDRTQVTGNRPSVCQPNGNFDFAFDTSTSAGKTYLSSVLSAYTAQKTVRLRSYETCNTYISIPDLQDIWLK